MAESRTKTTIEIPTNIFKVCKAKAALQGLTLREFFLQALTNKISEKNIQSKHEAKKKLPLFGSAKKSPYLLREIKQIEKTIEQEFSKVNQEEWK